MTTDHQEWHPTRVFSVGCRVHLTPEKAADYVILSRRGDLSGRCTKVGRKFIHWTTKGGARMANVRNDLTAE